MTLFRSSRYRFCRQYQVSTARGEVVSMFELREFPADLADQTEERHTVTAGETFETLAYKYYGDCMKWYVIADANPQIFFPLDLASGMQIRIPPRSYAMLS